MKLNVNKQIREMMPEFFKGIEEDKVYVYDNAGFTGELTDKMTAKIAEMKEQYKLNVVAVIDCSCKFPDGAVVDMVCYVHLDKYKPWKLDEDSVAFFANVVNEAWDVEELGSIGLAEKVGRVFRTY